MRLNPEFQRNLWLELTLHRLIAMPVVLGLVFGLIYSGSSLYNQDSVAARTAAVLFFVLTVIWGGKMAAESVLGEIRDRTWDAQRMSPLSPWSMTWGKLFGSTIFAWYGGLICGVVFAVNTPDYYGDELLKVILITVGVVVLAQATALLFSLQMARKGELTRLKLSSTVSLLGAIIVAWVMMAAIFGNQYRPVRWFGDSYNGFDFALASVGIFLGWVVLGIYRLMRAELQVRNTPLFWILFCLFMAIYFTGFVPESRIFPEHVSALRLFFAYTMMLWLTYLMIFSEKKDPVAFRRLFYNLRLRQWRRFVQDVPCWFASLVLVVVTCLVLMFGDYPMFNRVLAGIDLNIYLFSAILFLVRDIAIVLFFNLGSKPERADATALVYLLILYILLPMLLAATGNRDVQGLFVAFAPRSGYMPLVSGAVQAVIMLVLLRASWQRAFAR